MRPGRPAARARRAGRRSRGARPRGERVTPVERPRDRLERVGGVGELPRLDDPGALGGGEQQSVVGPDEEPTLRVLQGERPPRAADAGVDDREVHPAGMYGSVLERTRAPWRTAVGGIPWVPSITRASGRDPRDDAVARPDEVVLEAEVGEEADDHRPASLRSLQGASSTAARRRRGRCAASASHADLRVARRPGGLGPDRDRWDVAGDAGERPGGGGGHEDDEVGRRPVRGSSSIVR